MDEVTTTEVDAVEPEMETEDTVENTIDNMSDEEFTKHFDNPEDDTTDPEQTEEVEVKESTVDELDSAYKAQMESSDSKLDKPILVKVDGVVYSVDNINELKNGMEKSTKLTQKFQKLSEDRKALEDQIKELGQTPNVPEDDFEADEIDSISNDILQSDYAEVFTAQVSTLPDEVKQSLATNPEMLKSLAVDYASGLGAKIMPQVHKLMNVNGLSFEDAYVKAGRSYQSNTERQTQDKPKTKMLKAEPKTVGKVPNELGRKAIDNMSDDQFDKYFASM